MPDPDAAMLVIGDEILSGRTRDSNLHHLASRLSRRGIRLREARVVPDEVDTIAGAVRELSARHDHLFTSGGIGPTHDDVTAEAIARAFGRPLVTHPEALARLERHYAARGLEMTQARRRMARMPEGARLIDNPVSVAPGFTVGNVHAMAGIPQVFEAMLAALLPQLAPGRPMLSQAFRIRRGEGEIADPLAALARRHPEVLFGSYPFEDAEGFGTTIVVRGTDPAAVDRAAVALSRLFPEVETE